MSTETVLLLAPEALLAAVATIIFVGGAFLHARTLWTAAALAGLFMAGVMLAQQYEHYFPRGADEPALSVEVAGPIAVDQLSYFIRGLVLLLGGLLIMAAARSAPGAQTSEYVGLLLVAIAGLMLVGCARELVLLFLGLEMISIPTYVLLYLGRGDARSQESAAKYFYLSILSSAVMLYGFSFLYGAAGSTQLPAIRDAFAAGPAYAGPLWWFGRLALALVIAGLAFKLAAVPFQFYAPDVYQGTTNANAAVLAVLPKVAALAALLRIVFVAMPGMEAYGWRLALILAVLTMTLGNLLALWQTNVRRLLAYSSVAHGGYMLIGLAVALAAASGVEAAASLAGAGAMLFYLAVYVIATTGALSALAYLSSDERQVDDIDELAGLSRAHPWVALALAIFMFSLAGIPPLAGFWGKLTLFTGALGVDGGEADPTGVRYWFIGLAVAGALNAAIAAAYYLRVIGAMYFRNPTRATSAMGGPGPALAMLASALLVVGIGALPNYVLGSANRAAESAAATPADAPTSDVASADEPAGAASLAASDAAGDVGAELRPGRR